MVDLSKNFLSYIEKLNIKLTKNLKDIDHESDFGILAKKFYLMKLADQQFTELEVKINAAIQVYESGEIDPLLQNDNLRILKDTYLLLLQEIRVEESKQEIDKNTGINLVRSTMNHFPWAYLGVTNPIK